MAIEEVEIWPKGTGILDLPDAWAALEQPELRVVAEQWAAKRTDAESSVALGQAVQELEREWAIETGQIENLYEIGRGATELLIEHGFSAAAIPEGSTNKDPAYVLRLLEDQKNALEGLFAFVKQDRPLSMSYIKELHAVMTRSQKFVEGIDLHGNRTKAPMLHGEWKKLPNYPRRGDKEFHYCPPEQTASEMDRLVDMHLRHVELSVTPEVEAAWLHHRFSQIHPFMDGNGRVARALATLVLIRGGLLPLVVPVGEKDIYLDWLERADAGNLAPLVRFISLLQERYFRRVLARVGRLTSG